MRYVCSFINKIPWLNNVNKSPELVPQCFLFLQVQHLQSLQSHYTTHTQVSVDLSPTAWYLFFISQHGEFETQPTQTTFAVWQMKLINNLKQALTVAHTMMPLNTFLPARGRDAPRLLSAHSSLTAHITVQNYLLHMGIFGFDKT